MRKAFGDSGLGRDECGQKIGRRGEDMAAEGFGEVAATRSKMLY